MPFRSRARPDDHPIGERGTLSSSDIVIAYSASGDSSGSPGDVPRASLRRRRAGFRLLQRPMRIETNVGVAGTTGAERQQRRQSQDGVPTERWRATRISSSPFAGSSYVVRNLSSRTDSALSWRASDSTSAGWSRNSFLTFGDLPASPAIPMARYASAGTAAGRSWPVTLVAAFRVALACAWWPTSAAGALRPSRPSRSTKRADAEFPERDQGPTPPGQAQWAKAARRTLLRTIGAVLKAERGRELGAAAELGGLACGRFRSAADA